MGDVFYVVGTVGFFGLMVVYVAACAKVGRSTGGADVGDDPR